MSWGRSWCCIHKIEFGLLRFICTITHPLLGGIKQVHYLTIRSSTQLKFLKQIFQCLAITYSSK